MSYNKKQRVYIVLVFSHEKCRVDSVYATEEGAVTRALRLNHDFKTTKTQLINSVHVIKKSVQGTTDYGTVQIPLVRIQN